MRRATDAIRLILIAYLSSQEIPIIILKDYVGSGPYIHGAKGISVNKQLNITSLRTHFMKDIPLAKRCFEETSLSKYIVRLTNECLHGIESSRTLSTLMKFASLLDTLGVGTHQLYKVKELSNDLTEADLMRMLAYLAVLFPAVIKITCKATNIHDFLLANFDNIKSKMINGRRSDVAELFMTAFTFACLNTSEVKVILTSPIVKFKIGLETLYNVFEYAYWFYVAQKFKEEGILFRVTTLQDLLPIINKELKKRGYTRSLTLRELFDTLKRIELESFEEGRIWFRIGWRSFPGEEHPIPVEFFAPKQSTTEELKKLGIPVDSDQAKMLWQL